MLSKIGHLQKKQILYNSTGLRYQISPLHGVMVLARGGGQRKQLLFNEDSFSFAR